MSSSKDKTAERARWIEAGKLLAVQRTARVSCPNCGQAFLEIQDVLWADGAHLDRYMACPACGSNNVLTKLRSEDDEIGSAPGKDIGFPSALKYVRSIFDRFSRSSSDAMKKALEEASPADLAEVTNLSIRLLENEAQGLQQLMAYADQLEADDEDEKAARVRAFAEGIMPAMG